MITRRPGEMMKPPIRARATKSKSQATFVLIQINDHTNTR